MIKILLLSAYLKKNNCFFTSMLNKNLFIVCIEKKLILLFIQSVRMNDSIKTMYQYIRKEKKHINDFNKMDHKVSEEERKINTFN